MITNNQQQEMCADKYEVHKARGGVIRIWGVVFSSRGTLAPRDV